MADIEKINYFAETDFRNKKVRFGIKEKDRARHMYVIGKTGMGKSTMLENMAVQDIQNGEGIVFIDPHGSTAEKLLDYVPPERADEVVYFAPFDTDYPISFNVMEDVGADKRHMVVSGLMSAFKKIWVDAWSARMEYILGNILLALLEYPGSTLLGVNRMLSDKDYRKKIVDNITDPSVKSFWVDEFAKYGDRYMQEAGAAIQNKVGQFTANPLIRNIIGQEKSSFDIRQIMDEKKILIVNLSKGLVGEQNASLLGGMLITKIYLAAMSRADLSASELKKMPNFFLYVDEFQSFANESFADILSEARKYKLNLIIAHQYIEQMAEEVRAAVFGNVGTTITFRVGPFDAEVLEKIFFPTFLKEDIVNLGFAQIYLSLMVDGVGSKPFSAVTLPPIAPPVISRKDEIIKASRFHFAKIKNVIEEEIFSWYKPVEGAREIKEKRGRPRLDKQEEFDNFSANKYPPRNQSNYSGKDYSNRNQGEIKRDYPPRENTVKNSSLKDILKKLENEEAKSFVKEISIPVSEKIKIMTKSQVEPMAVKLTNLSDKTVVLNNFRSLDKIDNKVAKPENMSKLKDILNKALKERGEIKTSVISEKKDKIEKKVLKKEEILVNNESKREVPEDVLRKILE